MKNNIQSHLKSYVIKCSAIALASLLTLTSVSSLAQSDAAQKVNANKASEISNQAAVVHLNNSTVAQLVTLKGIGQKKAQAIIAYREQVGAFKSVADLTQVKGIGDKVLNDNKARLQI